MLRIGIGYDLHRFAEESAGRPLVLGGVVIPGAPGLAGHSDADALLHSICDAVLGALGLGDLGGHFPDTDPAYEGVRSLALLERVAGMMRERGYRLVNLDAVIVAQRPVVAPHVPEMRRRIAAALGATEAEVSVKGTSPEGLTDLGRGLGIAAESVVLLGRV